MIVLNTGNGKGKTTAALGAAARAVGRGQRVLMIQFIKGPWKSGEDFIEIRQAKLDKTPSSKAKAGRLSGKFKLIKMGLGFVGILGDKLPRKEHINAAKNALKEAEKAIQSRSWDIIILDEVNVAVSLRLISAKELISVAKQAKANQILVLTGRGAAKSLIKLADIATEMKELKHPFNNGKQGKINIEF